MKIEKINDNIIKVTISLNDLEERNIDLGSLNYNSPAAQELFWDMMEQAEIQFGFTATDSQLVFEAAPDTSDGFIVTITRLDEDGEFESIHKYIKSKYRNADLRTKKRNRKVCSTVMMYTFKGFNELVALCSRIQSLYSGDSTLYRCKSSYYLMLTGNGLTQAKLKTFETILSEYGTKLSNTNFYEGYLNEYGEKILESNAIDTISKYF